MKRLWRPPGGLGAKLFVSHFLVALVGALTMFTVILVVAPLVFGNLSGGEAVSPVRAFGQALLYSLLVAVLAATAVSSIASLLVSRRVVDPMRDVLSAARRIASGRYGERVPVRRLGELSEGFNAMARALDEAERRRADVISDLSHEMRTPLSTLRGYMEGLAEGVIEPSDEVWDILNTETERMERLVDDLRQLSQAEAGRLPLDIVPVSPAEPVRRVTELMMPLFEEKRVRLESTVPGGTPPALMDADRVVQVLTNLLSNALRHTPPGGLVLLEVGDGDGEVTFRVTDTGEGISSEHLPHVFERFYRADKSRSREGGGSGVGLAISRALVEAMDGRMWVVSPGAGKGATFSFTLPINRAES
ncbi:MAG TPA: HAMP domain-containing sensor histidine kinase [Rubrobacter sp.]|nr:HAMP domain-containing sensor histidine kinase [Rubrobacter sp.]